MLFGSLGLALRPYVPGLAVEPSVVVPGMELEQMLGNGSDQEETPQFTSSSGGMGSAPIRVMVTVTGLVIKVPHAPKYTYARKGPPRVKVLNSTWESPPVTPQPSSSQALGIAVVGVATRRMLSTVFMLGEVLHKLTR
jgi:hypothetical protein